MIRVLVCWLLVIGLTGCVTTTKSGEEIVKAPDLSEAAQLNLQLGVSYYQQGSLQEARDKLEKAIEQKPDLSAAHRVLGLVYQRMGEFDEAEDEYLQAMDLTPKDPDTLNDYAAFLCFERGKVNAGLKYFDKAIAVPLNDNRSMLFSNAANCAAREDLEKAEAYLRAGLAQSPENVLLIAQLGDISFRQGQYLQARIFIQRAMAMSTSVSPSLLYLAAKTEEALGNNTESRAYKDQLLKEFPLSQEALAIQEQDIR